MAASERSALIGRDSELARITSFLDGVDRFPKGLLVEGEPGIGKSALWRTAVEASRARPQRTLVCDPGPAETHVAFSALGDLLEDVPNDAFDALPSPQRRAVRIALSLDEPEGGPPDQRATFTAVLGIVRHLARDGPAVVAVDDVHFLDQPSASVLEYVARRLAGTPVGLLLTVRVGSAVDLVERLERSMGAGRFERVALPPLTLAELHHVFFMRLGTSFPRSTLRRIHHEADGNPLLALEIARALLDQGDEVRATDPLPVPTELQELLVRRLDGLPRETRRGVLVVSALAEPTLPLMERALGPDAAETLEPAFDAHVLRWEGERIRCTHPLLAAAVYSAAGPAARREVHRQLVDVASRPGERARHMAMTVEGHDPSVADALDTAAEESAWRGVPSEAADLVEHAIRLTPPDAEDDLRRRKGAAAQFHFTAGRIGRSRELLEELVRSLEPGPERARALLGLASSEGDMNTARKHAEQARVEGRDDHRTKAAADNFLTYIALGSASTIPAARHFARSAVDAARKARDARILTEALAAELLADTLSGVRPLRRQVEEAVELEGRLHGIPLFFPPSLTLAIRDSFADRHSEAHAGFDRALLRAHETGDEMMQSATLLHRTELECRMSEFQLAYRSAIEGLAIIHQIGFESRQSAHLYALALAATRLGRADEARDLAERGVATGARHGIQTYAILSEGVLGSLELSLGHVEEAADRMRSVLERLRAGGFGEPGVCLAIPDGIEAMIAVGDTSTADEQLRWLEERASATDGLWARTTAARCRALLTASEGRLDDAIEMLERALTMHDDLAQPYEKARTLLALGATLRRARKHRRARDVLTEAQRTFEELSAALWAERARSELARIGGRAPSRQDLTPSERRVAELVATGRSNREVAEQLVVSIHTVETHLSNAYAKLGVHTRTALAHRLLAASQDDAGTVDSGDPGQSPST